MTDVAHRPDALTLAEAARIMRAYRQRFAYRLVWIYAIQAGGHDGPVKIGITSGKPRERLATLQQGNALNLRGLAAWRDFPEVEKELHEEFKHLRIRGEWFRPDPEMVDFLLLRGADFCDWERWEGETP